MTRQVPLDRPLSDEDREYLHARGQHARVEQIDADFPAGDEDLADEGDEDTATRPNWESMNKTQLETEVDRVNAEYDETISKDGTKADILARLAEWWNRD